jgi:hypothetical protein
MDIVPAGDLRRAIPSRQRRYGIRMSPARLHQAPLRDDVQVPLQVIGMLKLFQV